MPIDIEGGGGGGAGFALGPVNNLFGATAGDATAVPTGVSAAADKAAAESTRDTYFTANPSNLAVYDGNPRLNIRLFFGTSILHQIRQGSAWVDNGSVTGVQGVPGSGTDFSTVSENHIPAIGPAPDRIPFDSGFEISSGEILAGPNIRARNIRFNDAIQIASGVEDICFLNMPRNLQQHAPLRLASLSSSDRVRNKIWEAATQTDVVRQPIDTETLVNPSFDLTANAGTADGFRLSEIQVNFAANATSVTLKISRGGNDLYEFTAGPFSAGLRKFILMTDPGLSGQPGFVDFIHNETYSFQVTGASLLGDTNDVPYYAITFRTWDYADMAHVSDILQSDWNQTDTNELDYIKNKPTLPTPRTDEDIRDVMAATLVQGTGISIVEDDANNTITISAAAPSFDAPRIENLSINISSRVDIGTDLNNSRTITFDLVHKDNIDGNLTLAVTVGNDITVTTPFVDGANTKTVTLSGITTAAESTLTFQLTGTDTNGDSFGSNIVSISIRNLNPHEYIYYGLSATNNPATIDTGTMTQLEGRAGDNIVSTGITTSGQYFIVLIPSSFTVNSITDDVLQQNVLSAFSHSANIRQINSENYDSYVLGPLNAGGSEQYTINLT